MLLLWRESKLMKIIVVGGGKVGTSPSVALSAAETWCYPDWAGWSCTNQITKRYDIVGIVGNELTSKIPEQADKRSIPDIFFLRPSMMRVNMVSAHSGQTDGR